MAKLSIKEGAAFTVALFCVWIVQGAVPFLLTPTMGQAVWSMGFAHSFANDEWLSIYARNIGAPEPAPIAFGLAGAWPASIFIRLGMHAADAYTAMAALWLTVAFSSAYYIARSFAVARYTAVLAALCWGTMPVIWAHAGYSMLSLGIGLLPFYFLVTIKLMDSFRDRERWERWLLLHPLAAVIAVFMDGYSFMMFAVGSSILIGVRWLGCRDMALRQRWARTIFPVHALSLALAYGLYASYVGRGDFDAYELDFFRGWGVDLAFMVVPTKGIHWLPDLMGLSVARNSDMFWGDASVWSTSFSLPLFLAALWALSKSKHCRIWFWGAACIAVFGFYMALGPSLKINTAKSPDVVKQKLMPKEYAIAPTGSALLSQNIPGFSSMRASYRWGALGVFGAWLLVVLALSKEAEKRARLFTVGFLTLVMLVNLPNPLAHWEDKKGYRNMFFQLDHELARALASDLEVGEMVAFLPWRNDFLVNYLAAKTKVITYNIGGDKNLQMARQHWPQTMRDFPMARPDGEFADRILKLLAERSADAVILPYIDMLWAAHYWPYEAGELRKQLEVLVAQLVATDFLSVTENQYYAMVRLNRKLSATDDEKLRSLIGAEWCRPPKCLKVGGFDEGVLSQVGAVRNGMLQSDGKAGFLLFGPYRPMDAGDYLLEIHGSGALTDEAWVDVVSEGGGVTHGKWLLDDIVHSPTRRGGAEVKLDHAVKDLEVRVFLGELDQFSLMGYSLGPLKDR